MKFSGLLVAANASGSGKTTATVALISALRKKGYNISPAKAGPDFLDCAWLATAAGVPAVNLDLHMGSRTGVQRLLKRLPPSSTLIVEGAMGLYDGDRNNKGSAAELAKWLNLPVLLLLNAKGMGQSIAALAEGFLNYAKNKLTFCGIVCSHVGSPNHAQLLKKALLPVLARYNVPLTGFLPITGAPLIPARHLGLHQAREIADQINLEQSGHWFADNCDLEDLIKNCGIRPSHEQLAARPDFLPSRRKARSFPVRPVVAIAHDEAFSFCYADLPALLEELGAKILFFSPLRDSSPPPCSGIYLPGGYPELYARQLEANFSMRSAIKNLALAHMPVYAECGGYIYLMNTVTDLDTRTWNMCGIFDINCKFGKRLAALGYRKAILAGSEPEITVHGHEFHYGLASQHDHKPLWQLCENMNTQPAYAGSRKANAWGSWLHLYPEGSRPFWQMWLGLAASYETKKTISP